MATTAASYSEFITSRVRRYGHIDKLELERNLRAFIVNARKMAEQTPDVVRTSEDVLRAVQELVRRVPAPLSASNASSEARAIHQKAIASAEAFEKALVDAPSSSFANALGLG